MIHRASTVSLPNLNTCHRNLRTSDKQQALGFQGVSNARSQRRLASSASKRRGFRCSSGFRRRKDEKTRKVASLASKRRVLRANSPFRRPKGEFPSATRVFGVPEASSRCNSRFGRQKGDFFLQLAFLASKRGPTNPKRPSRVLEGLGIRRMGSFGMYLSSQG